MKHSIIIAAALAAGVAAAGSGPAGAHHSFAMYDSARTVSLKGTVKSFQWSNPHALLWIMTGPDPGQVSQLWSIELSTSPGNLTRMGWSKRSLKPGDRVIVDLNPLRDGQHGGALKTVTLVDTGESLTTTAKDVEKVAAK